MKIINIQKNNKNLRYPIVSFNNGISKKVYIEVLMNLFGFNFWDNYNNKKITKGELRNAYKKAYQEDYNKLMVWLKNSKSNYKYLPLFLKGLYSELKELNLI